MNAVCSVAGCEKPVRARGWCPTHLKRWQRHGDPSRVPVTPPTPAKASEASGSWRRWGPEGRWNCELDESDQFALVGLR